MESRKDINPDKGFPRVFAEGMGTLIGYETKITLSPDAQPRFHRPRSAPYALQEKVEKELVMLQREGILQPVESSDCAAPIVILGTSKKRGRFDTDLWGLQSHYKSIFRDECLPHAKSTRHWQEAVCFQG